MICKLGLLAKDIHNSVLPRTYDFFGKSIGVDVDFALCNVEPEQFDETVEMLRRTRDGFTVTMPYKIRILDKCDALDESAARCGSANTILVRDGKLIGYNTDGWGMVKCLALRGIDFAGKTVTMVGAGGVALSIAYHLLINGVKEIKVLNVFQNELDRLVERMGEKVTGALLTNENLCELAKGSDVFINASILGQVGYDDYTDFAFLDELNEDAIVFDVNYSNPDARLPREAKDRGYRSFIGKAMSSCQGIRAMEIWTGEAPSDETARELVGDESCVM